MSTEDKIETILQEQDELDNDTLERILCTLAERVDELEEQHQRDTDRVSGNVQAAAEGVNKVKREVDDIKEHIQRLTQDVQDIEVGVETAVDLTKVERILLDLDPEPRSKKQQRAVEIAKNWRRIASVTANGKTTRINLSNDDMESRLSAWRGEDLSPKQVHRAFEELQRMSDGKIKKANTEGRATVYIADPDRELYLSRDELE